MSEKPNDRPQFSLKQLLSVITLLSVIFGFIAFVSRIELPVAAYGPRMLTKQQEEVVASGRCRIVDTGEGRIVLIKVASRQEMEAIGAIFPNGHVGFENESNFEEKDSRNRPSQIAD